MAFLLCCCWFTLEGDTRGELERARAGAFGGLERCDGTEPAGIHLHVRRLVVAMVKDVRGFDAELETGLLAEGDALQERKGEVSGAGANYTANGRVAEATDAKAIGVLKIEVRKRIGIQPLGGGATVSYTHLTLPTKRIV